jgi:hypothetical protein
MRFYATMMEQVETVAGITGAEDILAALKMTHGDNAQYLLNRVWFEIRKKIKLS